MIRTVSRRTLLSTLGAVPAVMVMAACSDSGGEAEAQTSAPADAMKPAAPAAQAPQPQGSVDMAELLKPGALPDKAMGEENAPVTIVEYASMTCPHCAHFNETTFPDLKKTYIDTGKVRYILREFPFDPRAEAGFMLARCAGDNYYAMIDVLFRQQMQWATGDNAREALLQIARLAGFTQESFEACLTDQQLLDQVRAVQKRGAEEFRIDSTPTFFINGKTYKGAMSIAELSAIIDPLL